MTLLRRAAVAVALAAAILPSTGNAVPRVCRLVGPGTVSKGYDALPDDGVRITSVDVASNRTYFTAVVRLKSVRDDQAPYVGRAFYVHFSRGEKENYVLEARLWGTTPVLARLGYEPERFREAYGTATNPPRYFAKTATAVADTAHDEVRISVPLTSFRLRQNSTVRNGVAVDYVGAEIYRMYGVNPTGVPAPASGVVSEPTRSRWSYAIGGAKARYVLGTPSCVPVGR